MKKIITLFSVFFSVLLLIASVNAQESFQPLKPISMTDTSLPCETDNCLVEPELIFIPKIISRPNYKPITIQDLSIKTDIIGNVANTTYEMVMYNPNTAILEAEFEFPLTENQTVAAIALDIKGKMREGVVVEKEKARKTFEAVVRQGADPLLVEKTAGNQFKTRIYPFSPNGTRKIRIILEEPLQKENGLFKYVLPLNFKQTLAHFKLEINLPIESENPPQVTTDLPDFSFTRSGLVYQSHFEAQDYDLNNNLSFNIPQTDRSQIFTHQTPNGTYFYGNIDIDKSEKMKDLPKKIAIVWDSSLSGFKRNITKEKDLLTSYLKQLNNVSVVFIPFDIEMGTAQVISVKDGNAEAILSTIDQIVYDGATRFEKLNLEQIDADEILLFTDGLNTFGNKSNFKLPNIPVYTINSSPEYASGALKNWANKTFATFINLTQKSTEKALQQLTVQPLRIIAYNGDGFSEIYPPVGSIANENINIAGILNDGQKELEIVVGYDKDHIIQTKKITISSTGNNPAVERLWAQQKIAYLEQDAETNKNEILTLGQKYSIVTENTSLLVLENASDYFKYHITPPAELQQEYDRLVWEEEKNILSKKTSAIQEAIRQANQVKEWWNREFADKPTITERFSRTFGGIFNYATGDRAGAQAYSDEAMQDTFASADDEAEMGIPFRGAVRERTSAFDGRANVRKAISGNNAPQIKATIQIKQWDPDVPYLKILKASKDAELYADYLKLKIGYSDQPSFYFDITDEFIRRNQYDKGLKVLSNIIEMELDNVELMRIAANKLLQMKEYDYAIDLFEKITTLRGEDPQSFRDLALAYQAKGNYQKAFDIFYYILATNWGRFEEIKQVIFVEINNLLSLHPEVDTKEMSPELIFNMPVDIRIILSWSTDNTDIDMHVLDPFKEECFYSHKLTSIGGRYTHDFTQGFGPEEFMLKKAANGKYIIRTNNFADHRQSISGPTTLYLDLYTNYSRPEEKHERILVRTDSIKEQNAIGEITWEKSLLNKVIQKLQ